MLGKRHCDTAPSLDLPLHLPLLCLLGPRYGCSNVALMLLLWPIRPSSIKVRQSSTLLDAALARPEPPASRLVSIQDMQAAFVGLQ